MDYSVDYASLARQLERQELESSSGASPQVYGQLLAIYLLINDLPSAKYLWKRIPDHIKTQNSELTAVWQVGKHLWHHDYPNIYSSITSYQNWPMHLGNIMNLLLESTRNRAKILISKAYSTISLNDCVKLLGQPEEEAIRTIKSLGWALDTETNHVAPIKPLPQISSSKHGLLGLDNGVELLNKLTQYVVFLEQCSN